MLDLIDSYRRDGDLMALLKRVRLRYGGISEEMTARLAEELGLRENELFGTTTFYSFLSRGPIGRHVIRFCRCLPCSVRGGDELLDALEAYLGVRAGATTADGRFTLQMVNCIGACDVAPALMVDETRYGNLSPGKVGELLAAYK